MQRPHAAVLIVDDNASIRGALRVFLESNTAMRVCDEAADGTEAVVKAKQHHPALVLMDVCMPNLNGVEAAALIRKEMPDTLIVVFTLFDNVVGQSLAKHNGIDLVVSKGEGPATLIRQLEALLADSPLMH